MICVPVLGFVMIRCVLFAGRLCIEVTPASKIAFISEELCIGCGICVKVLKIQLLFFSFSI